MDEYRLRYVGYPEDRKAGLVQGREYASLAEAQVDPALTETACPYCGETVTLGSLRNDPGRCWPMAGAARRTSCAPCACTAGRPRACAWGARCSR